MATDLGRIIASLDGFYDFTGRTVVLVGAGGGQLLGYALEAARLIAVDRDGAALLRLARRVEERGLTDRFRLVREDFLGTRHGGDAVVFEFCLHEMPEPERALTHAAELARDVLVVDHAPSSPWSWVAAEDGAVKSAWTAVERRPVRRRQEFEAFQQFERFEELEAKLASRGPESRRRVLGYRRAERLSIPMPYRMALL